MTLSVEELQSLSGDRWVERRAVALRPGGASEFTDAVQDVVLQAKSLLQRHRKHWQEASEDQITSIIVGNLNVAGFIAEHDAENGGHADISVRSGDQRFDWLAEAKIWRGNAYASGGLDQLLSYSSGSEGCAMLFYIRIAGAEKTMQEWRNHLVDGKKCLSASEPDRGLAFDAVHRHSQVNELPVWHLGFALHWTAPK